MNLVSNAAEALPEGGEILISTATQYLGRSIKCNEIVKEGDYVNLKISDNGIGISPQDIEKIFEPFFTKKKLGRSGTGLGMAVVWDTVQNHNGYIDVHSLEDMGTTINIYLPATRNKLADKVISLPAENYSGNGESILVVDDIAEQREIARTILKELGYEVAEVSSGENAVKYVEDKGVDLLVLNLQMEPGMNGLETYKEILKSHPRQKAILVSGFLETSHAEEALTIGVGQFVKKPYNIQKIAMAVKAELGVHKDGSARIH
jgi:CheY-like chemotaxis protein